MSHQAAAKHLRQEVISTAKYETGRLVDPASPAYFGAVRAVMSDVEYVGALFNGWDGKDDKKIATRMTFTRCLADLFAPATRNAQYATYAKHLYELYRCGTVHLRAPKQLRNVANQPEILSWTLMVEREESIDVGGAEIQLRHLSPFRGPGLPDRITLPVSIAALFEDFVFACEHFASALEVEQAGGGIALLRRWESAAIGLCAPTRSSLSW